MVSPLPLNHQYGAHHSKPSNISNGENNLLLNFIIFLYQIFVFYLSDRLFLYLEFDNYNILMLVYSKSRKIDKLLDFVMFLLVSNLAISNKNACQRIIHFNRNSYELIIQLSNDKALKENKNILLINLKAKQERRSSDSSSVEINI